MAVDLLGIVFGLVDDVYFIQCSQEHLDGIFKQGRRHTGWGHAYLLSTGIAVSGNLEVVEQTSLWRLASKAVSRSVHLFGSGKETEKECGCRRSPSPPALGHDGGQENEGCGRPEKRKYSEGNELTILIRCRHWGRGEVIGQACHCVRPTQSDERRSEIQISARLAIVSSIWMSAGCRRSCG